MKYLLALLALPMIAQTLPLAVPMPSAVVQFVDANGTPISGGKLYTCAAFSSCPGNPQATYTDSTASVQNRNPIILDSAGRAQVWIGALPYRLVLQDANGVQQWDQDNVFDSTQYFVEYVRTVGTATLISYQPPNSQPITTVDAELTALTTHPYTDLKLNCGAKGDGSTNDAAAISTCLGNNAIVFAPAGTYCVTSPITIPNKTQLIGAGRGDSGGPNTVFKACTGFPNVSPVISLCAGPSLCVGTQAENFTIDCNNRSGSTGAYNAYAQEQSWFRKILAVNCPANGFWIDGSPGGVPTYAQQNSGSYSDLEALPASAAVAATTCFKISLLSVAFRGLNGLTCNPDGYTVRPDAGIVIEGSADISNVHVEHVTAGVSLGTGAGAAYNSLVKNLQAGPDVPTAILVTTGGGGNAPHNINILNASNATMGGNVLVDNYNTITIDNSSEIGFFVTGTGAAGQQTVITSRADVETAYRGPSFTIKRNLKLPGTLNNDASIVLGTGNASQVVYHDSPVVAGTNGLVIKIGAVAQGRPCLLIQATDASAEGATGGGLCLNAGTDAAFGMTGAGYTGDGLTLTARASTAASTQYNDGVVRIFSDSGLTPGSNFTATPRFQVDTGGPRVNPAPSAPSCAGVNDVGRLWADNSVDPVKFKACEQVGGHFAWQTATPSEFTTAAGATGLGSNSPAATPGSIFSWFKIVCPDGTSTCYVPIWK